MSAYKERAVPHIDFVINQFAIALHHLPELKPLFNSLEKNNHLRIGIVFSHYQQLVRNLYQLSEREVDLIKKANKKAKEEGISTGSEVEGGADHFLSVIGKNGRDLRNHIDQSRDPVTLEFTEALSDLTDRMTKGHELAENGKELHDGASAEVDWAIHGHTKGLKNKAMTHFIICHFLERTITQALAKTDDPQILEMISHKDYLLQALTDIICLKKAKGKFKGQINDEIYRVWSNSRKQGGLKWLSKERQKIYNSIVNP